jgi:hypothetical protein
MKTAQLKGYLLNWAVGKCEGLSIDSDWDWDRLCFFDEFNVDFEPTDNWMQAGKIIERERICLIDQGGDYWQAVCGWKEVFGDTPLIAAMRCYVASKLGDEVEVPDELLDYAHE